MSTIKGVCKEQRKALKAFGENQHEQQRKEQFVQKLSQLKTEHKTLQEEKLALEKEVNSQHNQLIKNRICLRNLKKNIHSVKGEKPKKGEKLVVTEQDLAEQQVLIEKLKELHDKVQKENELRLIEYEKQKKELLQEQERLEKIIKEKEKEMRLNTLKLKEIRTR